MRHETLGDHALKNPYDIQSGTKATAITEGFCGGVVLCLNVCLFFLLGINGGTKTIRNTVNIRKKNQDCECGNEKTRLEGDRKEVEPQRSDRKKGIGRKKMPNKECGAGRFPHLTQ